ncbi:cytochrome D1 domain-containing protein [Pseudomonadota bacterium]
MCAKGLLTAFLSLVIMLLLSSCSTLRGTGDMGVIIERAAGRVMIVENSTNTQLGKVDGIGDLSHASVVYSRDQRYAYVFGRDGGLTKIDLLRGRIEKRIIQAGNSIGGAISQDGQLVAVSNYKPGGVRVFNAKTLELVADIPAIYGNNGQRSKVVGLVDAPGHRFIFTLYDGNEIWVADMHDPAKPKVRRFKDVGKQPYDALVTPDGRYYIAGLFGENGLALLDLWNLDKGVKRILGDYGRDERKMPVYKMPHLEGWAVAGDLMFVPAVGQNRVLVINMKNWELIKSIDVHGQPIFVMGRPDGRQVWVNYAFPNNDTVQVIDVSSQQIVKVLHPGKAILHMEFTPRGEQVWISARDSDQINVYDTQSFNRVSSLVADKPSGIFFTARANKIGL